MKARIALASALVAAVGLAVAAGDLSAANVKVNKAPINPVLKAPLPPPPPPVTYRFSVDTVEIGDTRSLHEDTDYVTVSLTGKSNQVKALGDVNTGNHAVGIAFDEGVSAGARVTMAYIVMNTGKDPGAVINYFQNFAWSIGTLGGQNWAGLLAGGCDGLVAKGAHIYTAATLATLTAGGKKITGHDYTPGTESPAGCGSNSRYWVDWTISAK